MFNKTIISGNLTRDPELKVTQNGTSVCNFSLAYNNTYTDSNGNKRDETLFLECTAWGKTGEAISKWFGKGGAILVHGKLKMEEWEDKQTGQKRSKIKLDCTGPVGGFEFMGRNGKDGQSGNNAAGGQYHDGDGAGNGGGDEQYSAPPPRNNQQGNRQPQRQQPPPSDGVDDDVPF